jgi:squalene-hopene/tetraprenyl-beta-curcumene cyclase
MYMYLPICNRKSGCSCASRKDITVSLARFSLGCVRFEDPPIRFLKTYRDILTIVTDINIKMSLQTRLLTDSGVREDDVCHALQRAATYAFNRVRGDGHWCGEVKSNATITAEYVFLYQALGLELSLDDRESLIAWFLGEQNGDGSWGIAPEYPGDVSTTTETYLALKLLNVPPGHAAMTRARNFVISVGGVARVRIFTRIYLATFGLFPLKAVPELPAELILMPSAAPINIYRLASWARSTTVPLLILGHHRPIYALPNGTSRSNDYLDELWCNPANKMTPYSPCLLKLLISDRTGFCFTVIDYVLHLLNGLRNLPWVRSYARRKCVQWIIDHQEEQGDWAGIFPPMHMGLLALKLEGHGMESPAVVRGLEAIRRFAWRDRRGMRIQACVSPMWDTILMTTGLLDAGLPTSDSKYLTRAIQWIQDRQLLECRGDWQVYKPSLVSGGFSFEYFNSWYPDVDDTAAAILAMLKQNSKTVNSAPVLRAVEWLLGMQNRDGGWGAFDHENDRLFLNKIPFSDMDSLCDPSTADVTGRVLEGFGLFLDSKKDSKEWNNDAIWGEEGGDLVSRIGVASDRAIKYLLARQEPTGSWYGRWGSNYLYGTSNVLCALAHYTAAADHPTIRTATESAIHWLKTVQNPDGGWGESLETYKDPSLAGKGRSTASQTAWALMGLLSHLSSPSDDQAITRGIRYLVEN